MFDREGAMAAFMPVVPYLPVPADASDPLPYDSRESKRSSRGHSYSSGGYGGSRDLPISDTYGGYGSTQVLDRVSLCKVYHEMLTSRLPAGWQWWRECLWCIWQWLFLGTY